MAKIRKYVKANSGSPEKFMSEVQNRIDELEGGDMMMSEDLMQSDDIMDGDILHEEVIGDEVADEVEGECEEMQFLNYQDFMNYYIENVDPEYTEEQVAKDIENLDNIIQAMDGIQEECPVFYCEEAGNPVIEINGIRYKIDYFEEGLVVTEETEAEDEELDVDSDHDFEDDDAMIASSYRIEDSYGAPQAGVDVKEFDEYYEMQDYLDENPDVMERIEEGYATVVEASLDGLDAQLSTARDLLIAYGVAENALDLVEHINGTSMQTYGDVCEYVLGFDIDELLEREGY